MSDVAAIRHSTVSDLCFFNLLGPLRSLTNSDLHFVDFDLLANDISRYRGHPDSVDIKVLSRALVYLKAVHDFTVEYHGK